MPVGEAVFFLRVKRRVGISQAESALRNLADAAPFAGNDLENFFDQILRRLVAFAADSTAVLVFHLCPARFKLLHDHQDAL